MEWLTLSVLVCGYLLERWFGFLKLPLLMRFPEAPLPVPPVSPVPALCGVLFVFVGGYFHHRDFESYHMDATLFFCLFLPMFWIFLNSKIFAGITRELILEKIGSKKGKNIDEALEGDLVGAVPGLSRVLRLVNFPYLPQGGGEECYRFIVLATAVGIETVAAPIVLFTVGGYLVFAVYTLLYLLARSGYGGYADRSFLAGMLWFPAFCSLLVAPVSAFASGKFFLKVLREGFRSPLELVRSYESIFLLNVRAMIAILEVSLQVEYKGAQLRFDSGDSRLNHRILLLSQRLVGISKFLLFALSVYLFMML